MAKTSRSKQSATAKRAEPIRTLLQALVRERVKTRAEKEKLAAFLEQTVASIDSMLYQGEGGLDSWISALIYCYNLDSKTITHLFSNYKASITKLSPVSRADQLWFDLDKDLSNDEKFYWVRLIKASIDLQKDIFKSKK